MNEAEEKGRLAARGLDVSVPDVARIYDHILGEKDNFEADRAAAAQILGHQPTLAVTAAESAILSISDAPRIAPRARSVGLMRDG